MKRTKKTAAKSLPSTTMRSSGESNTIQDEDALPNSATHYQADPQNLVRPVRNHGIETAMAEFQKWAGGFPCAEAPLSFNRNVGC